MKRLWKGSARLNGNKPVLLFACSYCTSALRRIIVSSGFNWHDEKSIASQCGSKSDLGPLCAACYLGSVWKHGRAQDLNDFIAASAKEFWRMV